MTSRRAGVLNDGRLLSGSCFNSVPRVEPFIFVNLINAMRVAEVRVTSSYQEPRDMISFLVSTFIQSTFSSKLFSSVADDDLLDLHILTRTSATDVSFFSDDSNLADGNCLNNNTLAFTSGETRSFRCAQPIKTQSVILFKDAVEEVLLHLCEVEVYSEDDVTDIPEPTWRSEWLAVGSHNLSHGLGSVPVFGRVQLQAMSGLTEGFVYSEVLPNSEYSGVALQYSDSHVHVSHEGGDLNLYCPDLNASMISQPICVESGQLTSLQVRQRSFSKYFR